MLMVRFYKSFDEIRGEWLWEIRGGRDYRVLAVSPRGCVKLMDLRKDFEIATGMYAPSIPKGVNSVTWMVRASYRPHKYLQQKSGITQKIKQESEEDLWESIRESEHAF